VKGAGIDLHAKLGDTVRAGEPLYRVHAQFDADLQFARQMTERGCAYRIEAPATSLSRTATLPGSAT
jgi:thymidine phosphorylase